MEKREKRSFATRIPWEFNNSTTFRIDMLRLLDFRFSIIQLLHVGWVDIWVHSLMWMHTLLVYIKLSNSCILLWDLYYQYGYEFKKANFPLPYDVCKYIYVKFLIYSISLSQKKIVHSTNRSTYLFECLYCSQKTNS